MGKWSLGSKVPEATQLAVIALLDAGHCVRDIAIKARVSESTVRGIQKNTKLRNRYRNSSDLAAVKKKLKDRVWRKAHEALDHLDEQKLAEASAFQLAGIAGLMTSKGIEIEKADQENQAFSLSLLIKGSYENDPHGPKMINVTPNQPKQLAHDTEDDILGDFGKE